MNAHDLYQKHIKSWNLDKETNMLESLGRPGFDTSSLSVEDKIKLVRESDGLLSGLLEGAKIDGDLDLGGCQLLRELPKGLKINGCLFLRECSFLEKISANLRVVGHVLLGACFALKELPEDMVVDGNLYLGDCPAKVPEGITVTGKILR